MIELLITVCLGLLSAVGILFGLRERDKKKELQDELDARKRMDEVRRTDDPDLVRDRLRDRAE